MRTLCVYCKTKQVPTYIENKKQICLCIIYEATIFFALNRSRTTFELDIYIGTYNSTLDFHLGALGVHFVFCVFSMCMCCSFHQLNIYYYYYYSFCYWTTLLPGDTVSFRVIVTNGSGYGLKEFWLISSQSITSNLEYYCVYSYNLHEYLSILISLDIIVSFVNTCRSYWSKYLIWFIDLLINVKKSTINVQV